MQSKNIRLTITPIQFVGSESDIDRVPDQGRYLVLPGVTFQKIKKSTARGKAKRSVNIGPQVL
jgi:hypothetical protein